jgi:hypothetical protein
MPSLTDVGAFRSRRGWRSAPFLENFDQFARVLVNTKIGTNHTTTSSKKLLDTPLLTELSYFKVL